MVALLLTFQSKDRKVMGLSPASTTGKKPKMIKISVTRFGEISSLWPFWKGSFSIWQNFELTLFNFKCYRANCHSWKWPKIEQTIYPSGHTDQEGKKGSSFHLLKLYSRDAQGPRRAVPTSSSRSTADARGTPRPRKTFHTLAPTSLSSFQPRRRSSDQ